MSLFKENKELGIKVKNYCKVLSEYSSLVPTYMYQVDGAGWSFWVDHHPTMNCQVNSIGAFNSLLNRNNILPILKWLRKEGIISKAQILVDVNSGSGYTYVSKIKSIFKPENIVFEQGYTSTNGSIMTMMLLKTNWLVD